MTTEVPAAVDEAGKLHDEPEARQMLGVFRDIHFVGDKEFYYLRSRKALSEHGATDSSIPRKGFLKLVDQPAPFGRSIHAHRHEAENLSQRLKAHKRITLRSDKNRIILRRLP